MKSLTLDGNQLTGPIPPALARLTLLEFLDLSDNQLAGQIPLELTQLTNDKLRVYFGNNQLTGW